MLLRFIGLRAGDLGVAAYFSRWFDALEAHSSLFERRLQDNRYYAERYLIPPDRLGRVLLEDLMAEDLDLLYARLPRSEVGPRAPSTTSTLYSTDEREYATLTREEVAASFESARLRRDRFEAFFWMASWAAPRPSELRVLKWERGSRTAEGDASL